MINPGEDLIVFIRHTGFSGSPNAYNFETYSAPGAVRVSTLGFNGTAGNAAASNNDALKFAFRGTAVPEPSSALLIGAAVTGLLGTRKRRRRV